MGRALRSFPRSFYPRCFSPPTSKTFIELNPRTEFVHENSPSHIGLLSLFFALSLQRRQCKAIARGCNSFRGSGRRLRHEGLGQIRRTLRKTGTSPSRNSTPLVSPWQFAAGTR